MQVRVEVDVLAPALLAHDGLEAHAPHHRRLLLAGRLVVAVQGLVPGGRHADALVDAVRVDVAVVAAHGGGRAARVALVEPGLGAAHHVVRVDQADDERERPPRVRVGRAQEGGGLLGGEVVVVGCAAAEHGRRLVAAGVGREPALEAEVREVAAALHGERAARVLAHVPLAAVLHVVPGRAEQGGQVLARRLQRVLRDLRLVLPELQHLGDAVLRRVDAGEDAGAAGRAHAGRAERPVEGEAVAREALAVAQVLARPPLRPVHGVPLLVGDEDDEIGPVRGRRSATLTGPGGRRVREAGPGRHGQPGGQRGGPAQELPAADAAGESVACDS